MKFKKSINFALSFILIFAFVSSMHFEERETLTANAMALAAFRRASEPAFPSVLKSFAVESDSARSKRDGLSEYASRKPGQGEREETR